MYDSTAAALAEKSVLLSVGAFSNHLSTLELRNLYGNFSFLYLHVYVCICMCMYMCMCIYIHTYLYVYVMCIYVHTHAHTHACKLYMSCVYLCAVHYQHFPSYTNIALSQNEIVEQVKVLTTKSDYLSLSPRVHVDKKRELTPSGWPLTPTCLSWPMHVCACAHIHTVVGGEMFVCTGIHTQNK